MSFRQKQFSDFLLNILFCIFIIILNFGSLLNVNWVIFEYFKNLKKGGNALAQSKKKQTGAKKRSTKVSQGKAAKAKAVKSKKNAKAAQQSRTAGVKNKSTAAIKKDAGKTKKQSLSVSKSTKKSSRQKPEMPLRIAFLGGLNEIGKNFTVFEYEDDMFILDCGMSFPDGDMLGVDLVIPDFTYVEQNSHKIRGIVITHGHEDHIGGLPYLLKVIDAPVYATALTVGLIENKLREHTIGHEVKLITRKTGDVIKLGKFEVELIHVNHSIPDSCGAAIRCPVGLVVHTGDFKVDFTPMWGKMTDLARFAELGNEGVLLLMADSTNAGMPGYTPTEQKVSESFDALFRKAKKKRIIVASFASNISRVQQVINCADKYNRKVAYSGRSMMNIMKVAENLGYLKVPENIIIDIDEIYNYPMDKVVLITTGSQGEPMAALSRMAYSDHKKVLVGPNDLIIISARPIPGNEMAVGSVVDELLKRGCEVVYESMYEVHVSGHACEQELKLIHSLVKPKFFIPVHGEQKHLRKHMEIAQSLGVDRKNIYIGDVGKVVELTDSSIVEKETVPSGKIFVDGLGVGDVGNVVLKDRKILSEDGIIIVAIGVDPYDDSIVSGPDIVSRGFVYVKENESLMADIRDTANSALNYCKKRRIRDYSQVKNKIKEDVSKLVVKRTQRSPMILPIFQEVRI